MNPRFDAPVSRVVAALLLLSAAAAIAILPLAGRRRAPPTIADRHWEQAPFEFAIGAGPVDDPFDGLAMTSRHPRPAVVATDITDVAAGFVADPFLWPAPDGWYLFYEILDAAVNRGIIGLSWSPDGRQWTYRGVVLREPFHLSFSQIVEWDGAHYMIPESYQANAVQLYRADDFPRGWRPVARLIEGDYVDSTLFRHDGRWWILTSTRDNRRLHLFHSDHLAEGWREHAHSPVIGNDRTSARIGGRVHSRDGRLYRIAQDCGPRYGYQTRVFEILTLTELAYEEREIEQSPVLRPGMTDWAAWGMHHLDFHPNHAPDAPWMATFDGYGPAQPDLAVAADFDDGSRLRGLSVRPRRVVAGSALLVRLYWDPPPKDPAAAFVHFEQQGRIVFQGDHGPAGRTAYDLVVQVPENAPPGPYGIHIGLARSGGRRRGVRAAHPVGRRRVRMPIDIDVAAAP